MSRNFFLICLYFSVVNCSILIDSVAFLKDFINHSEHCSFLTFFTCGDDSKILSKDMKSQHKFLRFSEMDNCSTFQTFGNIEMYISAIDCASNILFWSDSCNFFARPFRWLFLYNQTSISDQDIHAYFLNISILIDSHVIVASLQENSTFILKRIFKFRKETELIEKHIGSWDSLRRLKMNSSDLENGYNMRNFQRTVLKTCLVITQNDSLNHLTDKRDKHIDSIAKVNYVLIQHLKDFVNADLIYKVTSTWGYKNNDSKWSGMIGELTERRADIGGTALFITVDRIAIIDYIAMTTKTRSKFVFREPKLSYVTNVFVLPFDWDVWISILGLLIIAGLVLLAIVKWEWKRNKYITMNEKEVHMELRDSVADVIFLTFGALCQQATSVVPFSIPGRITTIFLFISLMFLYTSYSANIVALLQSSSKSIQTLDDLLKSRLEVGVDDTVFNHFYFPNATEPVRKAIYEKKVAPPGQIPKYFPILEGVKKMREGLFAFHMETGPGYKLVAELFDEGEKCGLQEIQYLQVPDPWLAIQKNSSFKEALKIGLFLIRESGLQIREIDAIYTKKPVCSNRGNSFISVGIVDCYAPTAVLLGGILLSLLLFIIEHNINCINRKGGRNIA